ncbi:unnamed protein product [Owenia fusiformis]|uniref:Phosphatidylcholine transfer protein n=1 Tax=Owenia fusiformis TaxID=6347 RepID=A0A8J1XZT8_OWEFU|nr:unnamed protein product [Owenia fusiformis]
MSMFGKVEFDEACKELDEPQIEDYEFFTESHDVYMDLEYRKTWDTYAKELREVQEGDKEGIYWQVNYPSYLFMSNRDYVYMRQYRVIEKDGKTIHCVLTRSEPFGNEPERSGVIRVDDYLSYSALTSDGQGGTKAFMKYYDNPKGNIPTMLINWAAKTGVPGFLSQMQTACKGYPKYLQSKQTT